MLSISYYANFHRFERHKGAVTYRHSFSAAEGSKKAEAIRFRPSYFHPPSYNTGAALLIWSDILWQQ